MRHEDAQPGACHLHFVAQDDNNPRRMKSVLVFEAFTGILCRNSGLCQFRDPQIDQPRFSNEDTRSPAATSTTSHGNACVPLP